MKTLALPLVALALFGFSSLTEEELECEHAAAAIEDCCPEVIFPDLTCVVGGCTASEPAFDEETSLCLQDMTCDEMRDPGADGTTMCQRVDQALVDREVERDLNEPDERLLPIEGLCP